MQPATISRRTSVRQMQGQRYNAGDRSTRCQQEQAVLGLKETESWQRTKMSRRYWFSVVAVTRMCTGSAIHHRSDRCSFVAIADGSSDPGLPFDIVEDDASAQSPVRTTSVWVRLSSSKNSYGCKRMDIVYFR